MKRAATHGGARRGPPSLYPGKREAGQIIGDRLSGIVTHIAFAALEQQRDKLSQRFGRVVSLNDTLEWCIRRATGTPQEDL